MAEWAVRRRAARYGKQSADGRALLFFIVLICSLGVYAYKHYHAPSLATVIGASHVVDGDTIDVSATRIRLEAIDAPEHDQFCHDTQGREWACGTAAARELKRHINGQDVRCEPSKFDRYKRVLAICFLPDGADVNAWMVRQGWALAFRSTKRYRAEQHEAEAAKRGLWAGTFTLPWEWRDRDK